jgi:hypothetical protein
MASEILIEEVPEDFVAALGSVIRFGSQYWGLRRKPNGQLVMVHNSISGPKPSPSEQFHDTWEEVVVPERVAHMIKNWSAWNVRETQRKIRNSLGITP